MDLSIVIPLDHPMSFSVDRGTMVCFATRNILLEMRMDVVLVKDGMICLACDHRIGEHHDDGSVLDYARDQTIMAASCRVSIREILANPGGLDKGWHKQVRKLRRLDHVSHAYHAHSTSSCSANTVHSSRW